MIAKPLMLVTAVVLPNVGVPLAIVVIAKLTISPATGLLAVSVTKAVIVDVPPILIAAGAALTVTALAAPAVKATFTLEVKPPTEALTVEVNKADPATSEVVAIPFASVTADANESEPAVVVKVTV